jgi:hypothetical protein
MRSTSLALLVLIASVGVGCGCGSGGTTDISSGRTITKSAFVKKADAICKATRGKILAGFKAVEEENPDHFQAAKKAMMAEVAIPALETQVEEIRVLGAPAGDAAEVDAILAATQRAIDEGPEKLAASYTFYDETAQLAAAYGLSDCTFE